MDLSTGKITPYLKSYNKTAYIVHTNIMMLSIAQLYCNVTNVTNLRKGIWGHVGYNATIFLRIEFYPT